ncbi:Mov34/MPN/PAD-1 family protein [Streptomyces sp. NBC_01220]|uniref:hypothetical protein n=1 Tax=Streptomyces sp. NBC_01220 TaxID=2903781 RepID=UPI00352BE6A2|nr:Mov34/MPN/PAD-1 family protein [Streptomyces sp. NBC_01220]
MWHTHPHTAVQPSATDRAAMTSLTLPLDDAPARALVLIAGGPPPVWHQWLGTGDGPDIYAHLATRTASVTAEPPKPQPPTHLDPVPWWPGGYSTRPHNPVPLPRKGSRS